MLKLLGFLSSYRVYIIIATVAFSAGSYSGYKACKLLQAAAEVEAMEGIHKAEEEAIKLKKEREKAQAKKYKEVKKYVENNPTRPGLNDDELKLFNLH